MDKTVMIEGARQAIEALWDESFVLLMAGKEGTSFLLQDPEVPAAPDEDGEDVRSRIVRRLQCDGAFRAAVKEFILAERSYGAKI